MTDQTGFTMLQKTIDLTAQEISEQPMIERYPVDHSELHRMLSIKEVCSCIPYSRRHIGRLVRKGLFPQPIFLTSKTRVWREDAVIQFIRKCEASGPPLRRNLRNVTTSGKETDNTA